MSDPAEQLKAFQPTKDFFVGIDSDGCVFDSMEIKHKECFVPMFIKHFGLQPVSKYAREVWEFVNLYSKTRGINRFPALSNALNFLKDRPEAQTRNVQIPSSEAVDEWIARETKLGNATLEAEVKGGNNNLDLVYAWSTAVNAQVEDIVHGVPPFPLVRECFEKIREKADAMCISQTPVDALQREWGENQLDGYIAMIAGQEMGTKTEHLKFAAASKYEATRILMIGDAPGDFKAAKSNFALFYPINPGHEEASWQRLFDEALDKFFNEEYAGAYEDALVAEFNKCLPENPPWVI
jgi:phosphoglycolate phosphatase-like HAD superfamily hydrolase